MPLTAKNLVAPQWFTPLPTGSGQLWSEPALTNETAFVMYSEALNHKN